MNFEMYSPRKLKRSRIGSKKHKVGKKNLRETVKVCPYT